MILSKSPIRTQNPPIQNQPIQQSQFLQSQTTQNQLILQDQIPQKSAEPNKLSPHAAALGLYYPKNPQPNIQKPVNPNENAAAIQGQNPNIENPIYSTRPESPKIPTNTLGPIAVVPNIPGGPLQSNTQNVSSPQGPQTNLNNLVNRGNNPIYTNQPRNQLPNQVGSNTPILMYNQPNNQLFTAPIQEKNTLDIQNLQRAIPTPNKTTNQPILIPNQTTNQIPSQGSNQLSVGIPQYKSPSLNQPITTINQQMANPIPSKNQNSSPIPNQTLINSQTNQAGKPLINQSINLLSKCAKYFA